jgi:hypothetical protein
VRRFGASEIAQDGQKVEGKEPSSITTRLLGYTERKSAPGCQKYHNLAKKGFYASVGELGDDMRQEN